ncbi:MAG: SUMF1/EgtB/PvdO family nonheme iron enzyme [Coleofasciculaceae cyanobacterium SM2_1_6]|nr:SUMF1/EgtB/PvdO family nonheme iron enzyme [Coleofasciculaceae cyanobacterium SM2_1_6]
MGRYALLVGISTYPDGLNPLPSAVRDIDALQEVLIDPEIGGFAESDVEALKDVDETAIRKGISRLFANRNSDDLLLFYFSGHGVTDSVNDFYLTGNSTDQKDLLSSAVPSDYIHKAMNQPGGSRRKVIILDCCHSGAFAKGMQAKDSGIISVLPKLGGEGRVILTASDSRKYAFEQEGFELSLYTHFLVEGLKTGAADRDGDGQISAEELHEYVRDKVIRANNLMSPKIYPVLEGYQIILAKAVQDDQLKFRKEVQKIIDRRQGKIFHSTRGLLNAARDKYKISESEAREIEQEILLPYQIYEERLKIYVETLKNIVVEEFPLSEVTLEELEELAIGLKEEDLQAIKERILAPKQAEYEQATQQMRQQQEAAEKQAAELLQRQQAELVRQQQLEAERKLEAERQQAKLAQEKRLAAERRRAKSEQELTLDLGQGITLELVQIPAGKFMMGSNESDDEKPIHEVTVQSFLMGKYAVTNAQWQAVMGTEPSKQYGAKFQGANQPVVGVSWHECNKFCKKLSAQTGKELRLPSEAEWEYACRAGTQTKYHFGDDENQLGSYAWYGSNSNSRTHPVGEKKPNQFGIYDMHGNVWEWCLDEWHNSYDSKPENLKANGSEPWGEINVNDNDNHSCVLRGRSWNNYAFNCRSALRCRDNAGNRDIYIGFRLVVA